MASSSGVNQSFQQQFKCNECSLTLNSAESLEVHRQYHAGNLMQQWAAKPQNAQEEKNNNMTKQAANIKREFVSNNSMQSDGSDMQKRSPEYQRTTPEAIYTHPPTPQSYQSAASPYQNNDNSIYSTSNYSNFQVVKNESVSPAFQQPSHFSPFSHFPDQQRYSAPIEFFQAEQNNSYSNETHSGKVISSNFRYNPYVRQQYYDSSKTAHPGSPNYPPQPTPSPSPKHCDKCGFMCETAAQLIDHTNLNHLNNPSNQYMFEQQATVKEEEVSQSEILDLDSQKVVHPAWAESKEPSDKRPNGEPGNSHTISTMLNPWPSQTAHQQTMFQADQNIYINDAGDQKLFSLPSIHQDSKLFSADQKMFPAHHAENQNFINGGVSSSSNPDMGSVNQQYRSFEHLSPPAANSVISSSQVTQVPSTTTPTVSSGTKSANWKSNEARRPKTYNCTACNKWFTSSGHLKRHYNTTLHKNAVKSSGQPDPATMPISAHHHPARDSASNKDDRQNSNSPREDSRGDDSNGMAQYDSRLASMSGIIQPSPNGPYDRSPSMHHATPMHSPLGQHHGPLPHPGALAGPMMPSPGFSGISNGSPPNGDAGLSPQDTRGLLTSMAPSTHGFNMMPQPHMMPMDASQISMYPNGYAPHVTQVTAITNNPSITGEEQNYVAQENQRLPSFAHIQAHRFGGGYASVGGSGSTSTLPSMNFLSSYGVELNDASRQLVLREEDANGRCTMTNLDRFAILPQSDGVAQQQVFNRENILYNICPSEQFSPTSTNNNNDVSFNDTTGNTDVTTYLNADINHEANVQSQDVVTVPPQDAQGESKENYEEGNVSTPSTPGTDENQEELSKTKCYDCDKVFNRPCYLTQHNKTFHSGDKPYKCQRCGKRFSDEETFERHSSKHAGDKPHKCEKCPKMFNHKTDLRRHICCHTGRKPYACQTCGKGFIRKDHMVKHMDTHLRKNQKLSAMRS
ncbi:uncharacterized protein [Euwallacea fornicatus]|uniref:uncharacterized protein n=1 Tax=Euwallacea fornicatus TaxID=995702 RepID=UPI00338EFE09